MGIKLTIMFAGKVLGDDEMVTGVGAKSGDYWEDREYGRQTWPTITVPPDYYYFSEDTDTFTMPSGDIGTAPFTLWSRGGSYDWAAKYQDKGTVKVTNGSTTVRGVGTTWLDVDYTGDYGAPGVWFGVTNDNQAYSRTGSVYDVDAIVSDTELRLKTLYTGNTDQAGNATYMLGMAIAYGHKSNPGSWSAYRGSDLDEPPLYSLNYPSWQDYYINSLNAPGINFEVFSHGYRGNCSTNYGAQALPLLIMGMKPDWNHDVFFDYTDRYIAWARAEGAYDFAGSHFFEDMWEEYRGDYGCIWKEEGEGPYYDCSACVYNCSGSSCITIGTLLNHITRWEQGNLPMASLMNKIQAWKTNEGC